MEMVAPLVDLFEFIYTTSAPGETLSGGVLNVNRHWELLCNKNINTRHVDQIDVISTAAEEAGLVRRRVAEYDVEHQGRMERRSSEHDSSMYDAPDPRDDGGETSGSRGRNRASGRAHDHNLKEDRNIACQDLMLWSIVYSNPQMTKYFWREGGHSIPMALHALRLLRDMIEKLPETVDNGGVRDYLTELRESFETDAYGVLDVCNDTDADITQLILDQQIQHLRSPYHDLPEIGQAMDVAVKANSTKFISHASCTRYIDARWLGKLDQQTGTLAFFLAMLCPLWLAQNAVFPVKFKNTVLQMGFRQRLKAFSRSPYVAFIYDFTAYVTLAATYTWMAVYHAAQPGETFLPVDLVVLAWMGALFVQDLGMAAWTRGGVFADSWKKLDVVVHIFHLIGVANGIVIRERYYVTLYGAYGTPDSILSEFARDRLWFALSVSLIWIGLLRFTKVSVEVGPKLIMMVGMMHHVRVFLALTAIIAVAFGAFNEVITGNLAYVKATYQHQTAWQSFYGMATVLLHQVTFRPWFQVFGELFFDEIAEEAGCVGPTPFLECKSNVLSLSPYILLIYLLITNV